jgi:hypothetical protein
MMVKLRVLKESESYTFRSYFEMNAEPEDILSDLGYELVTARLSLPKTLVELPWELALGEKLERSLSFVSLTSETARRETLVAPILLEVAMHCQAQLRIEYPLVVSDWLKGNLDYFLRLSHNMVVIEAKKDDLTRGFTQLAAEMIALAQSRELESLYGAVTIGDAWRFGFLDVAKKQVMQDFKLFTVPDDLGDLIRILVGVLEQR